MNSWQQAYFAGDLADLVKRPSIWTAARIQNLVAEDVFFQPVEGALGQLQLFFVLFRNRFRHFSFQLVYEVVALFLRVLLGVQRILQVRTDGFLQRIVNSLVEWPWLDFHLLRF